MNDTPTVLLVDDHPVDRKLARILLELEGCRVKTAGSAEEALPLLRREPPQLLVLDLNLPGQGGLELAAALRSDPALGGVPILAVSSTMGPRARGLALGAGCAAFCPKPLEPREFTATIHRLLTPSSPGANGAAGTLDS